MLRCPAVMSIETCTSISKCAPYEMSDSMRVSYTILIENALTIY